MKNALSIAPPMPAMPKGKGKAKNSDDYNRGELSGINIEFTENGCNVNCRFEPAEIDPKFDRYGQMPEPEEMSFGGSETSMADAKAYVNKMMDAHAAYEAEEDKPAGKKPAAPPEPEAA